MLRLRFPPASGASGQCLLAPMAGGEGGGMTFKNLAAILRGISSLRFLPGDPHRFSFLATWTELAAGGKIVAACGIPGAGAAGALFLYLGVARGLKSVS